MGGGPCRLGHRHDRSIIRAAAPTGGLETFDQPFGLEQFDDLVIGGSGALGTCMSASQCQRLHLLGRNAASHQSPEPVPQTQFALDEEVEGVVRIGEAKAACEPSARLTAT